MTQTNILLIFLISLSFISTVLIASIIFNKKEKKWKLIIHNTLPNKRKKEMFGETIKDKSTKRSIKNTRKWKWFKSKIEYLYYQSGQFDKTVEDFLFRQIKMFFFGVALGVITYVSIKNMLFAALPFLLCMSIPFVDIMEKMSRRRAEFKNDFPFFLKTLSFVLQNGGNETQSIIDVSEKMRDGVLKSVLEDVIVEIKISGGNFSDSFDTMAKKFDIDEVKDFIEVVKTNAQKGVGVAETFSNQSDFIGRMSQNKKNKKLNAVENKVLVPLIIIMLAIGILFIPS